MESTEMSTELNTEKLQSLLDQAKQADGHNSLPDGTIPVDEYGLPFEPEGNYDSAPLQFEEMAQALWIVTNNIHYAATRYNRHSPVYFTLITQLEKNIKQLGSCCITKIVLQQSGKSILNLDGLTIQELYCMVSLHFRKCMIAYSDIQAGGKGQDLNLVSWLFRWAALAERLKATEEKILNIRLGKISLDSLRPRTLEYDKEPKSRRDTSEHVVSPKLRASALPIMNSFAAEVRKDKLQKEKEINSILREAERELSFLPGVEFGDYKYSSKPIHAGKSMLKFVSSVSNSNGLANLADDEFEDPDSFKDGPLTDADILELYRHQRLMSGYPEPDSG